MCRAGQGAAPLSAAVAVCVPRAHRPHVPPQNCGPSAHPCGHSTATVRPFGTRRASGTARSTAAGGGRWRGGDGCSLGWRQRGRGATGTGGAGPGVQAEPWGLSRGTEPGARGWARGGGTAGRHPNSQRDAMGAMGMEEAGITPSTKSPRVQPQLTPVATSGSPSIGARGHSTEQSAAVGSQCGPLAHLERPARCQAQQQAVPAPGGVAVPRGGGRGDTEPRGAEQWGPCGDTARLRCNTWGGAQGGGAAGWHPDPNQGGGVMGEVGTELTGTLRCQTVLCSHAMGVTGTELTGALQRCAPPCPAPRPRCRAPHSPR